MKYNRPEKSSLAKHMIQEEHYKISQTDITLIQNVTDYNWLDAYESYFIGCNDNLINLDNGGNIMSNLFK